VAIAAGRTHVTRTSRLRQWLSPLRAQAICVGITFAAMFAGLLTSQMQLPAWLPSLFYLIAYVAGGIFGVQASVESLRQRRVDVDLLMVLAALGAAVLGAPFEGAMLLFLFSLSNLLQDYALGRTRSAIQALMKLRPDQALLKVGQDAILRPIESLRIGDHILVRPGERVPLDGVVVEGESTVDESTLTGESMPVAKKAGAPVFAGTINQSGSLEVRVTKLAHESTIARLIKLVEEAQSEKAPTERFLDKFEQIYAMGVIGLTLLLAGMPPLLFGVPFADAAYRAITVMVVASPCALVISTPAAILSAIANGARRGILFKGGAHLEEAARLEVIAFDKTGTLTMGKPAVTDVTIIPLTAFAYATASRAVRRDQENILLALAAAVESKSEHPLARAIVETARHRGLTIPSATNFASTPGQGVRAHVAFMGGMDIAVGSLHYFDGVRLHGLERAMCEMERLQYEGKTAVLVAKLRRTPQRSSSA
jgi:Cd2+/Zn2+-exporting ATPase